MLRVVLLCATALVAFQANAETAAPMTPRQKELVELHLNLTTGYFGHPDVAREVETLIKCLAIPEDQEKVRYMCLQFPAAMLKKYAEFQGWDLDKVAAAKLTEKINPWESAGPINLNAYLSYAERVEKGWGTESAEPESAPAPAVSKETNWKVRSLKSDMTDDLNVYAVVVSNEVVKGDYGDKDRADLMLRCHENKTDAYFVMGGLFLSDTGSYDIVEYRLDRENMKRLRASASTDNEAFFIPKPINFIKELFGKDTLTVRFTPFDESPQTISFDISGTEEAVADLRKTCSW